MAGTGEIANTEQRLTEVDALQQTIDQLREDLNAYSEALRQELAWLQKEEAIAQIEQPVAAEAVTDAPPAATGSDEDINWDELVQAPAKPQRSPFELDEVGELGEPGVEEKVGGKPVSVLITDSSISDEPLSGWVIDRPPGSLKILVDDEIKVGTVIGVRPSRDHPQAEWINVSVKHVRPERQSFVITCQFVGRPPWTALALLNGQEGP
jgi:hypothetical protein